MSTASAYGFPYWERKERGVGGGLGSEEATLNEAFHSGETAGRRHMGGECGLFTEPEPLSTGLAV